jgi:ubiquinone/menaquinone biosynthesis C-methylase UbiE
MTHGDEWHLAPACSSLVTCPSSLWYAGGIMSERVCPWWLGYLLANPVRKLFYNPESILKPYVREGMTVLEVGSGMGFFTLPLARLVGESGHVVCVDLQEKMIKGVEKRAVKAGLIQRIELRVCTPTSLGIDDLTEKVNFALVFAVVHEVPDAGKFLSEVQRSLSKDGLLLFSEPTGHVSREAFQDTLATAQRLGFRIADSPKIRRSHSSVWVKQ